MRHESTAMLVLGIALALAVALVAFTCWRDAPGRIVHVLEVSTDR